MVTDNTTKNNVYDKKWCLNQCNNNNNNVFIILSYECYFYKGEIGIGRSQHWIGSDLQYFLISIFWTKNQPVNFGYSLIHYFEPETVICVIFNAPQNKSKKNSN